VSTLVVGVGSPFGDDRVGWDVVTALEVALQAGLAPLRDVRTCAFDRPGALLVEALQGVQHAVIVDAALGPGVPAGTMRWLDERDIEPGPGASSHGFGLAEALALARALGTAPERVDLLAIYADGFEGDGLSRPLRDAVPAAVQRILERIGRMPKAPPMPG
jgi:hydrogenase maturation protease